MSILKGRPDAAQAQTPWSGGPETVTELSPQARSDYSTSTPLSFTRPPLRIRNFVSQGALEAGYYVVFGLFHR